MDQERTLRDALAALPVLIAVADAGSITGAADELRMQQSTVTRVLQRLEGRTGVALRRPDGRGIVLTPAGEALVARARSIVRDAADALESIGAHRDQLSIVFQASLGEDLMPRLLSEHLRRRPDTDFTLEQGAQDHCLDLLEGKRVDFAVVNVSERVTRFERIELVSERIVLAVPAAHPLAGAGAVRLADLADERFVLIRRGFGLRAQIDALLDAARIRPAIAFEGYDLHMILGFVGAGLGVALVPRRGIPPGVVAVELEGVRAERTIALVFAASTAETEAGRALVETVRASI